MTINLRLDRLHPIAESQRLLLDALLLPEPQAGQAFLRWLESVDLDKADFATYRLIPVVYARHAQGAAHLPDYGRMKGIYRYFHVKNTLLMADARQAVEALNAAGVEVVALKGLAWSLKYYERSALRVMLDSDLLVSRENFEPAIAILSDLGWQYRHSDQHRRIHDHSIDFTNARGRALDLHVRCLAEVQDPAFDELVFAQSQAHEGSGPPMRAPRAEHLVLIGLVNAVREPEQFRLEWICDLTRALAATPSFDWGEVCRWAHDYGVAAQVFDALMIAADLPGLTGLQTVAANLARPSPRPRDAATVTRAVAQHMRLYENERGDIEALFLRWEHISLAPQLFDIADEAAWRETVSGLPAQGAGLLDVAPGLLQRRSGELEAYRAAIEFTDGGPPLALTPGASVTIPLRVTNRSEQSWLGYGAADFSYGVSWHVYLADGEPSVWDRPRYYFVIPKDKYLVFLTPGMAVDCRLEFTAPEEPGDYLIKLDIVHEGAAWFASPEHRLPEWRLSVVGLQPALGSSDTPAVAQDIRIFETDAGEIEALFLRWKHLSLVPQLFDILDWSVWESTARGRPTGGAGRLEVAPGLLKRRPSRIEAYRASIEFADGGPPLALAPGASVTIPLNVTNRSKQSWTGYGAEDFSYGVSWHVYLGNGEPSVWDRPRCYFLTPRDKYLVFLTPGMAVDCLLDFTAPEEPGDYLIKLDVVHEGAAWFASPEHRLPEWRLSVVDLQPPLGSSDTPAVARDLRVFESDAGEIEALFLHWEHLSSVPQLFDILDRSAWEATARGRPTGGAGRLDVAPGLLKRRPSRLAAYRASIEFADGAPPAELAPGVKTTILLRIVNQGAEAWIGYGGEDFPYGVSWHEHRADGEPLVWDRPRYYFLAPKDKYLTFLAPGMAVECPLAFSAPDEPGDYLIKLDIVHEGAAWFASAEHRLPEWRLVVTGSSRIAGEANGDAGESALSA